MEKLSLQQMNELYQNNPQKYMELFGEKEKTFNQLSLKEQSELYNKSKEMYEYYSNNPNEPITMKTNDFNVEQHKTINDMKDLQKEINQMKSELYKDFPNELEWEKRIDELVEESLKNITGGN